MPFYPEYLPITPDGKKEPSPEGSRAFLSNLKQNSLVAKRWVVRGAHGCNPPENLQVVESMLVQVIPDTDISDLNFWRKRHQPRKSLLLISFCAFTILCLYRDSPACTSQRKTVKLVTHIAPHPYPHIPSVCAYKLVTNTVRPSFSGRLVFNLSPVAPRRSPPARQTSPDSVRLIRLPRVASDIKTCSCLLDHTLHQDSLYSLLYSLHAMDRYYVCMTLTMPLQSFLQKHEPFHLGLPPAYPHGKFTNPLFPIGEFSHADSTGGLGSIVSFFVR